MNPCLRDWLRVSPKTVNPSTSSRAHFSVGGRPPARILGPAHTEDCKCSDRQSLSCFNLCWACQFVFRVQCMRATCSLLRALTMPAKSIPWNAHGSDESIHVGKNLSLEPMCCNWFWGTWHMPWLVCNLLATLANQSLWLCRKLFWLIIWQRFINLVEETDYTRFRFLISFHCMIEAIWRYFSTLLSSNTVDDS